MSSDNENENQPQEPDWRSMSRQEREGAITETINEALAIPDTQQGTSPDLDENDDTDDGGSNEVSLDDITGPPPSNDENSPDNDNDEDEQEQEGEGSEPSTLDERIAQAEATGDHDRAIDLRITDALGGGAA